MLVNKLIIRIEFYIKEHITWNKASNTKAKFPVYTRYRVKTCDEPFESITKNVIHVTFSVIGHELCPSLFSNSGRTLQYSVPYFFFFTNFRSNWFQNDLFVIYRIFCISHSFFFWWHKCIPLGESINLPALLLIPVHSRKCVEFCNLDIRTKALEVILNNEWILVIDS